ncbi:hypothetical protein [Devosia sp. RR2S18]|uniref:hypothetical protein n=1 Tax=Devosia rhizosphaerae TaxID=3049774 RepID=UPI002542683C|nr:hypothetical protein [Devosia sp. RR2S18]WIJ24721.1 hypothetical protein QOV41_17175 [Devosia sp. RR2S18]
MSQSFKKTGPGTAPPKLDVADPHPSNEEHYDRQRRPGGDDAPRNDLGPNDGIHNGYAGRDGKDKGSRYIKP